MKFLIDNNLSPALAALLRDAGHDAVHVAYRLNAAADEVVLERARAEERVLVAADTDFATLLARQHAEHPFVLQLRQATPRRPGDQAPLVLANLPALEADLLAGAIVTVSGERMRVNRADQPARPATPPRPHPIRDEITPTA